MDKSDVNAVVDNLAERIGVAAEAVKPIAEETVRQFVAKENVGASYHVVAAIGSLLFGSFLLWGLWFSPPAKTYGMSGDKIEQTKTWWAERAKQEFQYSWSDKHPQPMAYMWWVALIQVLATAVVLPVTYCEVMDQYSQWVGHKCKAMAPYPAIFKV